MTAVLDRAEQTISLTTIPVSKILSRQGQSRPQEIQRDSARGQSERERAIVEEGPFPTASVGIRPGWALQQAHQLRVASPTPRTAPWPRHLAECSDSCHTTLHFWDAWDARHSLQPLADSLALPSSWSIPCLRVGSATTLPPLSSSWGLTYRKPQLLHVYRRLENIWLLARSEGKGRRENSFSSSTYHTQGTT